MSDEQRPGEHQEPKDEVEAHHHNRFGANAEAADEAEAGDDDNEVEAHHHARNS